MNKNISGFVALMALACGLSPLAAAAEIDSDTIAKQVAVLEQNATKWCPYAGDMIPIISNLQQIKITMVQREDHIFMQGYYKYSKTFGDFVDWQISREGAGSAKACKDWYDNALKILADINKQLGL